MQPKLEVKYRNDYFICFKNIIYAFKILAIFPFVRFNKATKLGRLSSIILTMISLTIYIIVVVMEENFLYLTFSYYVLREFNFENIIRFILQAMARVVFLTIPFLLWNKNGHLRNYWDDWMNFHISMAKLAKTSLKSTTVQYQVQSLFIISNISMTVLSIMIAIRERNLPIVMNPFSLFYIGCILSNLVTYWVFNNYFIVAEAKKMINLVQQALYNSKVVDLSQLVDLWMMLCDLNEQFVNGHSMIFLIMFSLCVICGVISVFTTVLSFVHFNDGSLGLVYLFGTFLNLVGIMTFCESANSVVNHMVYKLKEKLLGERLDIKNKPLLSVIILFLHTIETRNPKVTLNRYVTIDRSIVPSVLNTAINFLVVLQQFSFQ